MPRITRLANVILSILCITLIFPALSDAEESATIAAPREIGTGEISLITIKTNNRCKMPLIRFSGKDYICFKTEKNGIFHSMIAAPLTIKPGPTHLEVFCQDEKKPVATASIMVKKKKYPEEHLKVAKKMVNFDPATLKRVLSDQKAVKRACADTTPHRYWTSPFIWPVNSKILSPFGLRRFFNEEPRSPHSGIDLRAKKGTPIHAANDGRVALARDCYLSGNTLVIDHGAGLYTLYAHLSEIDVKKGEMVKKGDTIGLAGSTGRATGPHLHWGVSLEGDRVDPESLMKVAGIPLKKN